MFHMEETVISFKNFGFQYYSQAEPTLHDINLDIHKGEKILIAGPSGSGKSTLGNCLNGLIPCAYRGTITGSLTVDGIDTRNASLFDLSQKIGTVLQDSDGQFIGLSVAEDIAFALENDLVVQSEMFERVDKVAKEVDVTDLLSHAPTELSGGQKRRVAVAGVLAMDPEVLLMDEPTSALDPYNRRIVINTIRKLPCTKVITSHDLDKEYTVM